MLSEGKFYATGYSVFSLIYEIYINILNILSSYFHVYVLYILKLCVHFYLTVRGENAQSHISLSWLASKSVVA